MDTKKPTHNSSATYDLPGVKTERQMLKGWQLPTARRVSPRRRSGALDLREEGFQTTVERLTIVRVSPCATGESRLTAD
jgi:hypothetical protein